MGLALQSRVPFGLSAGVLLAVQVGPPKGRPCAHGRTPAWPLPQSHRPQRSSREPLRPQRAFSLGSFPFFSLESWTVRGVADKTRRASRRPQGPFRSYPPQCEARGGNQLSPSCAPPAAGSEAGRRGTGEKPAADPDGGQRWRGAPLCHSTLCLGQVPSLNVPTAIMGTAHSSPGSGWR